MTDQIISSETAKLAKEKGFNEHICRCGGYPECICNDIAPTQSLLQKWLREVHGILLFITYRQYSVVSHDGYYYCFSKIDNRIEYGQYKSYESALEQGLKEALLLIS